MCQGGKDGPDACQLADMVRCPSCGSRRRVEDTDAPGPCPECGAKAWEVERCVRCPLDDLEYVRSHSAAGHLLNRLLDLEFTMKHFHVSWSEVTAEEVRGLRVLAEERSRYASEQSDRERQDR